MEEQESELPLSRQRRKKQPTMTRSRATKGSQVGLLLPDWYLCWLIRTGCDWWHRVGCKQGIRSCRRWRRWYVRGLCQQSITDVTSSGQKDHQVYHHADSRALRVLWPLLKYPACTVTRSAHGSTQWGRKRNQFALVLTTGPGLALKHTLDWFQTHPKTRPGAFWRAKPVPAPVNPWVLLGLPRPVSPGLWFCLSGFSIYGRSQTCYCSVQNINFVTSFSLFVLLAAFIVKTMRDMLPATSWSCVWTTFHLVSFVRFEVKNSHIDC